VRRSGQLVIAKVITSGSPHVCNHLVIDRAFLVVYLSLRRRLRKGARARRRLAIALRGFSVAVQRVARARSQIKGLVGSRGISGVMVGWVGLMEMTGVVVVCMGITFWLGVRFR
jgi:hypothetical protein